MSSVGRKYDRFHWAVCDGVESSPSMGCLRCFLTEVEMAWSRPVFSSAKLTPNKWEEPPGSAMVHARENETSIQNVSALLPSRLYQRRAVRLLAAKPPCSLEKPFDLPPRDSDPNLSNTECR